MSAITGIGDSATIVRSASASCSRGTAQRTTSAPASATLRIWSSVAVRFAVSVLVIVCTTTGAPPPIGTRPTKICRWEAIEGRLARHHTADTTGQSAPWRARREARPLDRHDDPRELLKTDAAHRLSLVRHFAVSINW